MRISPAIAPNVSICVRAGLPKPRCVPDTERTKDTKTLDYASTPLDANTLLCVVPALLLIQHSCTGFGGVSASADWASVRFIVSKIHIHKFSVLFCLQALLIYLLGRQLISCIFRPNFYCSFCLFRFCLGNVP